MTYIYYQYLKWQFWLNVMLWAAPTKTGKPTRAWTLWIEILFVNVTVIQTKCTSILKNSWINHTGIPLRIAYLFNTTFFYTKQWIWTSLHILCLFLNLMASHEVTTSLFPEPESINLPGCTVLSKSLFMNGTNFLKPAEPREMSRGLDYSRRFTDSDLSTPSAAFSPIKCWPGDRLFFW